MKQGHIVGIGIQVSAGLFILKLLPALPVCDNCQHVQHHLRTLVVAWCVSLFCNTHTLTWLSCPVVCCAVLCVYLMPVQRH